MLVAVVIETEVGFAVDFFVDEHRNIASDSLRKS